MKKKTFKQLVGRLCLYYDKRQLPTKERVEALYEQKMKYIAEEAVPYVERHVKSARDSMPINIPKALDEGWQMYRITYGYQGEGMERHPCKECGGRGLLWGRKFRESQGREYTQPFRCASCENWRRHFNTSIDIPPEPGDKRIDLGQGIPLATKDEMRLLGFQPETYVTKRYETPRQAHRARTNSKKNVPLLPAPADLQPPETSFNPPRVKKS